MTESALSVLFGAYLNQDLYEFYADEFAAVDDFAARDPELANTLADEVDALLVTYPIDEVLTQHLFDLGVELEPDDVTYRTWLTRIADRVRAATASP